MRSLETTDLQPLLSKIIASGLGSKQAGARWESQPGLLLALNKSYDMLSKIASKQTVQSWEYEELFRRINLALFMANEGKL